MSILISEDKIKARVKELGREISEHYKGVPFTFLVVLKGAVIFGSDLFREIKSDLVEIDFVRLSSYSGTHSTGNVEMSDELSKFKGKNLLVVEDIVDTGNTLSFFLKKLEEAGVASAEVAALFEKKEVNRGKVKVDYLGFDIGNEFIIGYGLDYNQKYRNLPDIEIYEGPCDDK